jgi:hypothetical protein
MRTQPTDTVTDRSAERAPGRPRQADVEPRSYEAVLAVFGEQQQAVTPDALQGRMNGTKRSVNRAMIVVGAPVGGVLADAVGYRPVLWAGAAGFAVVAAGLAASPFRQARHGDPAGAPATDGATPKSRRGLGGSSGGAPPTP